MTALHAAASPRQRDRWALGGLGSVLILVHALCSAWGLPESLHPDERTLELVVSRLSLGQLNPHFFYYPTFFLYQLTAIAHVGAHLGWHAGTVLYASRVLVGAYHIATVGLLYSLTRRIGSPLVATAVAAVYGFAGPMLFESSYALVNVPMAALALTCIWFLTVEPWRNRPLGMALAGAAAGLALSTKYSAAPLALPLAWGALRPVRRRPLVAAGRLTLAWGTAVMVFALTSPYVLIDASQAREQLRLEAHRQALGLPGEHVATERRPSMTQRGLCRLPLQTVDDVGWPVVGLALGGVVLLFVDARRRSGRERLLPAGTGSDAAPMVLWLAGSYGLMSWSAKVTSRYALPLYPEILFLAALPLGMMERAVNSGCGTSRTLRFCSRFLVFLALVHPVASGVDALLTLTARDTRLVARAWILDHVPKGATLLVESYGPPIHGEEGYRIRHPRFSASERHLRAYCNGGVDYLVLSSAVYRRFLGDDRRFGSIKSWYYKVFAGLGVSEVALFEGDERGVHDPTIHIYRLQCAP